MTRGFGRFDDLVAGRALVFAGADEIVTAATPAEVVPVLQAVSAATAAGRWAFGYVGYDAAPGLDPLLTGSPPTDGDPPPAWFAITGEPADEPVIEPAVAVQSRWQPAWRDADYDAAIETVRSQIAAGESYQVNLTSRMLGTVGGDPLEFYASMVHQQRGTHAAYLDLGSHVVASASPELFFAWDGRRIVTRPMKGTARRGRTTAEDGALREGLLASAKERAEHIIVVDLLRNDLGRIAEFGSVLTPRLGVAERYESVWQLTSDVVATTRPDVGLADIFAALFPSGSVTGAPKRRTMQIISDLEPAPRGVYCGAIGVVSPPGAPHPRARFSVAIRTAVLAPASGAASYGVGGGITAGSVPAAERSEMHAKAAILSSGWEEFSLFETLFCSPGAGLRNCDRHLARLGDSASYFGFAFDRGRVVEALESTLAIAEGPTRVRLALDREGTVSVRSRVLLPAEATVVRLAVDTVAVDTTQRWLFHKTTRRAVYEQAAARHGTADDVVLVNGSGNVTETTVASLAVRIDGEWCTPPVASGCLPGVERGRLVETGALTPRDVSVEQLRAAEAVAVVSSLRGWRAAVLAGTPATPGRR